MAVKKQTDESKEKDSSTKKKTVLSNKQIKKNIVTKKATTSSDRKLKTNTTKKETTSIDKQTKKSATKRVITSNDKKLKKDTLNKKTASIDKKTNKSTTKKATALNNKQTRRSIATKKTSASDNKNKKKKPISNRKISKTGKATSDKVLLKKKKINSRTISLNKQKLVLIFGFCLIIFLLCISFFLDDKEEKRIPLNDKPIETVKEDIKKEKTVDIKKLQEHYQNEDIISFLDIPDVLSYPIVKSSDNNYYLNHQLDHSNNIKGTPFMDYRVNPGDNKVLIYGHSGNEKDLPFLVLHYYREESFYEEHPMIYLYSEDYKYSYHIISSYVETKDFDYVNINGFNGLSWSEHINKLKDKSDYKIDMPIDENSKILILQTCGYTSNTNGGKYKLVIGLLVNVEEN